MALYEVSRVATSVLPMEELADFMRLRTDATGSVRQDQHLEVAVRAAISELETRTGRVILRKEFELRSPLKPVVRVPIVMEDSPKLISVRNYDDMNNFLLLADFEVQREENAISIKALKPLNKGDKVYRLAAGQEHWSHVLGDLQLATLALATHFYDTRNEELRSHVGIPKLVQSLVEKYRVLRVFKGY